MPHFSNACPALIAWNVQFYEIRASLRTPRMLLKVCTGGVQDGCRWWFWGHNNGNFRGQRDRVIAEIHRFLLTLPGFHQSDMAAGAFTAGRGPPRYSEAVRRSSNKIVSNPKTRL